MSFKAGEHGMSRHQLEKNVHYCQFLDDKLDLLFFCTSTLFWFHGTKPLLSCFHSSQTGQLLGSFSFYSLGVTTFTVATLFLFYFIWRKGVTVTLLEDFCLHQAQKEKLWSQGSSPAVDFPQCCVRADAADLWFWRAFRFCSLLASFCCHRDL